MALPPPPPPPPTFTSDWNWHGTLCRSKRGLLRSKVLLLPQLALDDKGGMMVLSAAQTTPAVLGSGERLCTGASLPCFANESPVFSVHLYCVIYVTLGDTCQHNCYRSTSLCIFATTFLSQVEHKAKYERSAVPKRPHWKWAGVLLVTLGGRWVLGAWLLPHFRLGVLDELS